MKRTFILLMSATALIAFLGFASAFGWRATTSTYFVNGHWQSTDSSPVMATSTSASVIVTRGYPIGNNCNGNSATIVRASDGQTLGSVSCTGTLECCKWLPWTAVIGTNYKSRAYQNPDGDYTCPHTTAMIQGGDYICGQAGPGGP